MKGDTSEFSFEDTNKFGEKLDYSRIVFEQIHAINKIRNSLYKETLIVELESGIDQLYGLLCPYEDQTYLDEIQTAIKKYGDEVEALEFSGDDSRSSMESLALRKLRNKFMALIRLAHRNNMLPRGAATDKAN